ncbi:transmembrane protein 6/97 [Mariannaea sp. PMI_226]|nr:transmembrane protein 6/97 [Mariannaea sp. PMI_226]
MAQKAWRDWVYLAIVFTQLFGMLILDLAEFYPKSLYVSPSAPLHFLVTIRKTYVAQSGDPFFRDGYDAPWFHSFLFLEALAQMPLAAFLVSRLASKKPTSGPVEVAGLAFACLTTMGSLACFCELLAMGPEMVKTEHKSKLLYATYGPFLAVPAVMAMDMYLRLLSRFQSAPTKPKSQ